jgi:hypothetical protein
MDGGPVTRILILLVALLTRPYHVETIASLATSRSTHVEVVGLVTLVKKEADGDLHFRLTDADGRFIVCEIIPTLIPVAAVDPHSDEPMLLERPSVGQRVRVRGIRRYDTWHRWSEIHPVEHWEPLTP